MEWPSDYFNKIVQGDCLEVMKGIPDSSVDLVLTDPPYGYSFMGKDWDKVVMGVPYWKECLRVLKSGAICFVMAAPRQDVLSRAIVNLQDAGFDTGFTSLYWAYASGFPKAGNIGKMVDKRNDRNFSPELKDYLNQKRKAKNLSLDGINKLLGTALTGGGTASALMGNKRFNEIPTLEIYTKLKVVLGLDGRFDELIKREEAEREVVGERKSGLGSGKTYAFTDNNKTDGKVDVTTSTTNQAKALDGSYSGFQPKPAVEVILVAMKPLEEKTYVDQAMKNRKGITWLDDCRIPYQSDDDKEGARYGSQADIKGGNYNSSQGVMAKNVLSNEQGRFPANLLVSDDVLNDGKFLTSIQRKRSGINKVGQKLGLHEGRWVERGDIRGHTDKGTFSRYFDLDKWASKTFPFLIVPKAGKEEKNRWLGNMPKGKPPASGRSLPAKGRKNALGEPRENSHPTVKPIKLMAYFVTLGSREKDIVLDPFIGSGTTAVACKELGRRFIGIEEKPKYCKIANKRLAQEVLF